jgi:hypothetical protein
MGYDKLKSSSLDWAIENIARYGDTDIFPTPFEYSVIKNDWINFRDNHFLKIDLSAYSPREFRKFLVPKKGGYRVAKQLDPETNIILTAMVKEDLDKIENHRVDNDYGVVCSYRANLEDDNFRMYKSDGYETFINSTEKYIESGHYEYVLVIDISDFYNQIYLHELANQLCSAGVDVKRARNYERILMDLKVASNIFCPSSCVNILSDVTKEISDATYEYYQSRN